MNVATAGETGFVVFAVGDRRMAIDLTVVGHVTHAVEVDVLAGAPACVVGTVDIHGERTPVIDMRQLLGMPSRELELADQFVLVQRGVWRAALITDGVVGVVELPAPSQPDGGQPGCVSGEVRLEEGTISIVNVSRLMSPEQTQHLRRLLAELEGAG